ncbi:S1 RNA binding domain [Rhizoctonia solani]|uniref:S1 RNA binding domain n=1 Tax=Rhizoctonia solani TaxID=456999 RepID=A0A8H7IDL8_9AGAM|nr:S1 RNA binding domain [Rhizoctonia solani]
MAPQKRTRDWILRCPGAPAGKKVKFGEDGSSKDVGQRPTTLLSEEVDFPRGGGVTLEELNKSTSATAMEVDGQPIPKKVIKRAKGGKKDKKGKQKADASVSVKSDIIRVEHLNYKLKLASRTWTETVWSNNIHSTSCPHPTPSNSSEAEEEEEEEEDNDGVPSLSQMFKPGQYVSRRGKGCSAGRAVDSTTEVNEAVGTGDLRTGFNITGAIQSVEDHGYIVDLGIKDVSGFIPYKDKSNPDERRLSVGQVVSSTVVKLSENKRLCTLSVEPDAIQTASLTEATSAHALLPGTLVSALVTAVVPSGLNLQVLGYFGGTIELFHLPSGADVKEGDKVKAEYCGIFLAQVPSLRSFVAPSYRNHLRGCPTLREAYPVGMILEAVKVTRVESEWGLVCEVTEGVGAFVHISQISDSLIPQLSSTSGTWRLGSSHRARVIGYHALDGLLLLSFKPSVLELEYMQVADVEVGKRLKGTIVRLRESGLVVALSDKVTGLVTPQHYADIKLKHPERKFKEGATIKCQVLNVNPERSRVLLTLKKSLLDSTLPILAAFEDAKVGIVTPGVVQRIEERFVILEYYGGVKALVPLNELTDTQVSSTSGLFTMGQVVKSRIISIDKDQHRLTASIRQAAPSFQGPVDISKVEVGSTVSGTKVAGLTERLQLGQCAWNNCPQLRSSLENGERILGLSVISVNAEKALVIVSAAKPKEKSKPKTGISSSLRIDALEEGQTVSGRITQTMGTGIGVRLSSHVVGRLHATDVADDYTGPSAVHPAEGSVVEVAIVRVDKNLKRVDVSMRKSRAEGREKVRGIVKSIVQHGIFVMLGRDLDARIQIKELFDEPTKYVKDWQSRFSIGQVVETRVLATNPETNQIELTMRSGDINKLLKRTVGLSDFQVGQKVEGRIKRVADFGIFIEISGTKISGLCHKSEISDNKKANVSEALKSFREDDQIKAVILSIDTAARKISFGIKPSYFDDEDFAMKDASEDGDSSEEGEGEGEDNDDDEDQDEEAGEEEVLEEEEEGEEYSDEELAEAIAEVALPEETIATAKDNTLIQRRSRPVSERGFNWSGQGEDGADEGASGSEGSDSEDEDSAKKSKKKKKRGILKDMTADLHTKVPESTADFERVLLGSPNSSYLWIQYMSFQLQLSEVDKAREIGRRALQTINYREEQEKLNVWIALLNLENQFGTEESLEALFKDAARHNDSKTVHLRMAAIFDESEKTQRAEEQYARTAKKFSQSSKVWTLFGEYYLKTGKLEESRKLLARSLLSLPSENLGDPERGKTIFEGIVESHPKRNDLWSMYIDMEVSQGNAQSIRNIFNRALARKLTAKQAKFFFKKWLEIEKRIGDDAGAEAVKEKAVAWMQSHSGSSEES